MATANYNKLQHIRDEMFVASWVRGINLWTLQFLSYPPAFNVQNK